MTLQLTKPTSKTTNTSDKQSITMPFKHGLNMSWQSTNTDLFNMIETPLNNWLFDSASLTKRLLNQCKTFEVYVLDQEQSSLSIDERAMFDCDDIHCREVLLVCDGTAHVYARTLMPTATLEHANEQLKTLTNSSLGEILFNDPSMTRSNIEVCQTTSETLKVLSQQLSLPQQDTIWGRRSMFHLNDYPLSVAEFFLPGSYAYSKALL